MEVTFCWCDSAFVQHSLVVIIVFVVFVVLGHIAIPYYEKVVEMEPVGDTEEQKLVGLCSWPLFSQRWEWSFGPVS